MDADYFERPWCLREFRIALAEYRAAAAPSAAQLDHVVAVMAAPLGEASFANLPPPLAPTQLPAAHDTPTIVRIVKERLERSIQPLSARLAALDDSAIRSLRDGAKVPAPAPLARGITFVRELPPTHRETFVDREDELWTIFHHLQIQRATGGHASCAIRGPGGVGKSQLAAEFAWRYGGRHFPGGVVWISADGDDGFLNDQLLIVAQLTHAGITDQRNGASAVQEVLAANPPNGPLLWIVDNVPEAADGLPPESLAHWCPVMHQASVVCTSRRAVPDAAATIFLSELTVKQAVQMLTAGAVKRSWLDDEAWEQVARWTGCLPLALAILNASLSEGFVDARQLLQLTSSRESAAQLDEEFIAVEEDMPKSLLRGITQTFGLAYSHLAKDDSQLKSAHRFARLSPIAVSDHLLSSLLPMRSLGKLSARGWVQPASSDDAEHRSWRMHRIVASFLNGRSPGVTDDITALATWLGDAYENMTDVDADRDLLPHFLYLTRALDELAFKRQDADVASSVALLDALALRVATRRFADPRANSSIYVAAQQLAKRGREGTLVQVLVESAGSADETTAPGMCAIIRALGEAAQPALLALLVNPRLAVRRMAMGPAALVAKAPTVMRLLLDALIEDIGLERLPLVESKPPHSMQTAMLWNLPCSDEGRQALANLGNDPLHEEAVAALQADLSDDGPAKPALMRAIDRLGFYVRTRDTPIKLRVESWGSIDLATREPGRGGTRITIPNAPRLSPELLAPLGRIISNTDDEGVATRAALMTGACNSGCSVLSGLVYDLLDQRRADRARLIAQASCEQQPQNANGYWWRALAEEALKQLDAAQADYGRVLDMEPKFSPALERRARLFLEMDEPAKALSASDRWIALEPDAGLAHHLRTLSLIRLERFDEAIKSASRTIEFEPTEGEAWYFRAIARKAVADLDGAQADADKALSVTPEDPRFAELRSTLLQRLHQGRSPYPDQE
jgi:tetratricopeptide (TPR) repeat protein